MSSAQISPDARNTVINFCARREGGGLDQVRERISDVDVEIQRLTERLLEKNRTRANLREEQHLLETERWDMSTYEEELDGLLSLPITKSVHTDDDWIKIDTNTIYATNRKNGEVREVGKFRIHIWSSTKPYEDEDEDEDYSGQIRLENLTRSTENRQHPHVSEPNEVCWGNMHETIWELYAKFQLVPLYLNIIMFLQSVNLEDTLNHSWKTFPVIPKETVEKLCLQTPYVED